MTILSTETSGFRTIRNFGRFLILSLLLICAYPTQLWAEDQTTVELPSTADAYEENWLPGERHTTTGWLLDQHNAWSHQVKTLGENLDGFFAGKEAQQQANGSYMKLGFRTVLQKAGKSSFNPEIRVKLDLPGTQKKFRLVFESDPEEGKSLEERNREKNIPTAERNVGTSVGAIRYITDSLENWQLSNDLGVKLRIPPNPFWRAAARRDWQLAQDWSFNFNQSVYYFWDTGFGETTAATFDHTLNANMLFRSNSQAQWKRDNVTMEYAQIFSIIQRIDSIRAAEWRVGALADNRPYTRITAYFTNVSYRRLLYKDWLFYEMTPELLFPKDDQFKLNPSLALSIEVIFSE